MTHTATKIASVPLVLALVLLAFWLGGGVISNDFMVSMALTAVLMGALAGGFWLFTRSRPGLRLPVLGTFLLSSAVIGGYLAWTTLRDDEVNETVVTGAPPAAQAQEPAPAPDEPRRAEWPAGNVQLQAGGFASLAHSTEGRAAVVELADGGKRLTLTGFETDPGPDLRVYLMAGKPSDGQSSDFEDIGGLKGNKGNQQYTIDGIDTKRYSTVVIWCRAFTVAFGQAPLEKS